VKRSNGLTVNWTGGEAGAYVDITGISLASLTGTSNYRAGYFTCRAAYRGLRGRLHVQQRHWRLGRRRVHGAANPDPHSGDLVEHQQRLLRGHRAEVRRFWKSRRSCLTSLQVGFVNQGGGLEGAARPFVAQTTGPWRRFLHGG
jgi:hypothetical protein